MNRFFYPQSAFAAGEPGSIARESCSTKPAGCLRPWGVTIPWWEEQGPGRALPALPGHAFLGPGRSASAAGRLRPARTANRPATNAHRPGPTRFRQGPGVPAHPLRDRMAGP